MEHSMKLVEEHCSKYLTMFGECVHQFPHTWQMDCEPERRKLARCAETNPEILHIKSACAQQFAVYEKCMNESKSDSDKCAESFTNFTSCAQHALGTFKHTASHTSPAAVRNSGPLTTPSTAAAQNSGPAATPSTAAAQNSGPATTPSPATKTESSTPSTAPNS